MPEDATGATPDTGATPGTTQQTGTQVQQAVDQQQPPANGDEPLGAPGLEALRREREARAQVAEENRRLLTQLRELQDKDKPEEERTKARLSELESGVKERDDTIRDLRLELDLAKAGAKHGVVDPELAILLMKQGGNLQFDADGKPTNTEDVLKQLIKSRPYLAQKTTGNPNAGAGNDGPPRGAVDMNQAIRQGARRSRVQVE